MFSTFEKKSEERKLFSTRLQTARKMQGIKICEIAKQLGVSRQAYSLWENGGYPVFEKIPLLCRLLDITPNYLFGFYDIDRKYCASGLESAIDLLKNMKNIFEENHEN